MLAVLVVEGGREADMRERAKGREGERERDIDQRQR